MNTGILCINAGSSSVKVSTHRPTGGAIVEGAVEAIGTPSARIWFRDAAGSTLLDETLAVSDHGHATDLALAELTRIAGSDMVAVGHRVVHGGLRFVSPTLVDEDVLQGLRDLVDLAPLHLPPQIAAIEAVRRRAPSLPQVACFDTAFHRLMPEVAQRLPLPEWAWKDGVRRFGFHGLSYEHAVGVLGPACGKVVIAHLGNGASMAAVQDGDPVDTTMGFTPTAGLMMGTRCGDLDPGLLVYLQRHRGMSADDVDHLVNQESGLLGVSGTTADMRTLLTARAADSRADRAIAMYCRSARKAIGALAAVLGGIDQLVFTGGIGEHAAPVRAEICSGLGHLGIRIDLDRNTAAAEVLSPPGAGCAVRIIPADEDGVIARHTARAVFAESV